MKKYFLFIITIILCFNSYNLISLAGAVTHQPQIVTNSNVYRFGTVKQGTPVEANFEINNSGGEVLKIEKIYSSCGCTAAMVNSETIAPGAKTNLKITFDTTGFSGKKAKTVRIFTNDPKQSSLLFTLEGEIKSDISLSIQKLNFGDIEKGQERVLKFSVATDKNSAVVFKETSSRSPYLELDSQEIQDSNQRVLLINVKLKSTLPVGLFRDRIVIKSNSTLNPVINLAVFARVQGDLKINPNILSLGLIEPAIKSVYKIEITNQSKNKINILTVNSDNPDLELTFIKKDDFHWTINAIIGENASGVLKEKIKISTDNPDENQREISVPIYAIIKAKTE